VALVGLFATVVALLAIVLVVVDRDRRYQALLAAGDRALAAGNAVDAAASYSSALGLRPQSMAAYLRRGQAYRAEQRDFEAIHDWREAAKLAANSTQPLELLGDILSSRGNDAEAATYYERAVQLDPADAAKLYKLGLARYRAGSAPTAIGPLESAISLNDNFAEAHYLLGLVLRDVHRPADAMASLERAVRVTPSFIAAHEELADLYRTLGRPVDELAQLQTLSSLDGSLPREVAIALAESRHGRFDGAIATLSAAAERDPADTQVQLALGRVQLDKAERTMDRRSVADALAALERALAAAPGRSEGLALLGRALYLSGDDAGAERVLRDAVSKSPVIIEAFGYLADACERQHEFDAARDALEKLDTLQGDTAPRDVRSARARRLGRLALEAGDPEVAIEFLQRAADTGARDAALLGTLAEAQFRAGNPDLAKTTLAEALVLQPKSAELLRLRRLIR
jgi:tetratricopeptide (TPR) repeat protein